MDNRCKTCGHPRDNHPYRHPFVGVSVEDELDTLRAEVARLREALRRIEEASHHYARGEHFEDTLRYAHESTRRLARAALDAEAGDE